jgi:hypothetical protein
MITQLNTQHIIALFEHQRNACMSYKMFHQGKVDAGEKVAFHDKMETAWLNDYCIIDGFCHQINSTMESEEIVSLLNDYCDRYEMFARTNYARAEANYDGLQDMWKRRADNNIRAQNVLTRIRTLVRTLSVAALEQKLLQPKVF